MHGGQKGGRGSAKIEKMCGMGEPKERRVGIYMAGGGAEGFIKRMGYTGEKEQMGVGGGVEVLTSDCLGGFRLGTPPARSHGAGWLPP